MATDFIAFQEGVNYLLTHGQGQPTNVFFLLSTSSCNGAGGSTTLAATATLAGGVGEITGTGYARQSQAAPTPASGNVVFSAMSWATGAAINWPANVRSVIAATTVDNTGKAICAWNLIAGGLARDLSQANTTENFTPTLNTSS